MSSNRSAQKMLSGFYNRRSKEKCLHEWTEKLQKTRERNKMKQEDSNSQRQRAWEKVWKPRVLVPSPFLAAGN